MISTQKKKTIIYYLVSCLILILSIGCQKNPQRLTILIPNGTPLLALSSLVIDESVYQVTISANSQQLASALINQEYDLIVAPINLGAKMYQNNPNYQLLKTITWGNYYLASNQEITNITNLENQTVTVFGAGSSPDLMIKVIIDYYQIKNVTFNYVDDVSTSNAFLITNPQAIIITAEPTLTKQLETYQWNILSLQEHWEIATDGTPFAQAGLFVNTNYQKPIRLPDLENYFSNLDYHQLVEDAAKIGMNLPNGEKSAMETMINRCNFKILTTQQEYLAITNYFKILIDYGYGDQIGGTNCDQNFWYQKQD